MDRGFFIVFRSPTALAVLLLLLTGCASDSGDGMTPPTNRAPTVSVSIADLSTAFGVGDVVVLTATVDDPDNEPVTVTWTVDGPGSLDVTTGTEVSWTADGTVGTTTITATASDGTATADDDLDLVSGTLITATSITADTTWDRDNSPYLVREDVTVEAGTTLTLDQGTQILFQGAPDIGGGFLKPAVLVEGMLLAQGGSGFSQGTSNQVEVKGGRALAQGEFQHRGLILTEAGSSVMTYTTISGGDVGVANQGSGSLSLFQCQLFQNVTGLQATGIRDALTPILVRRTRLTNNSSNGLFVRDDHVRLVDSNVENNSGFGINATAGGDPASADVDSCVVRNNNSGNLRAANTGSPSPLTFLVNACNLDQSEETNSTMIFAGCLSFLNTIDITGNFWLNDLSATTEDVLATMENWESCDPDLADWIKGVDWFSQAILGAGI